MMYNFAIYNNSTLYVVGGGKMDWNTIWENTISGVLVVWIGGAGAWLAYAFGIRGKERAQEASARKKEIYIPLKYELKRITDLPYDIWKRIETCY